MSATRNLISDLSNHDPQRRYDLDWLRVIAFGLLIYFHAAVVFIPHGIPMVANAEPSPVLQMFVAFLQEFRLGLLFLVSGMGVRFALGKKSSREFLSERARRLLIPLVFGILVLVPPMVFVEKIHVGATEGSFLDFYAGLFVNGIYPTGSLSWHQFWFVAYLFLFCVIGIPVFHQLVAPRMMGRLAWFSKGGRIGYFVLALLVVELPLRFLFPGFRDLIHDWASFFHWWLLFLFGFAAVCHRPLLASFKRLRYWALSIGLVSTGLLFLQFFEMSHASFSPLHDGKVNVTEYIWFCTLRMINAWSWLVVCVGFAGRYLNHGSTWLTYLTDAVYPLFCVHLTLTVVIAYFVVQEDWSIAKKYLLITSATLLLSFLAYESIKRVHGLRSLFGLKRLD